MIFKIQFASGSIAAAAIYLKPTVTDYLLFQIKFAITPFRTAVLDA